MAASNFNDEIELNGKIVVITGSNTGIGYETALALAKRGAHVTLACRDRAKGELAAHEIRERSTNPNVFIEDLDLADLESIRDFAKRFKEKSKRLDILINNAGVFMSQYGKTKDGFEMHFGVNYLSHFLLTNLLLDLIKSSTPSRIINMSSDLHKMGSIHWDDINIESGYGIYKAYSQSKLANVLFTVELNKRLKDSGVTVVAVDPGLVNTDMSKNYTGIIAYFQKLLSPYIAKSPEQGAATPIYCATATTIVDHSGEYFSNKKASKLAEKTYKPEDAARLWELSAKMVNLNI